MCSSSGGIRRARAILSFCFSVLMITLCACGDDNTGIPLFVKRNEAPHANAGTEQKVAEAGIEVSLDGSGSGDPEGDNISYLWTITGRPLGSLTALSSAVISNPTFTPDKAGKYDMSLIVSDGALNSPADTVAVWVGRPVPDTGQLSSVVSGDDGDHSFNPMSYTDNGDGTVLDNVSGLTWQKCSVGQSGSDCAASIAAAYNWYQAAGIYHVASNPDTINICGGLALAGSGWRLPTFYELSTILDYGVLTTSIDTAVFPGTLSENYWTSTGHVTNTADAWVIAFADGNSSQVGKTATLRVRCVR